MHKKPAGPIFEKRRANQKIIINKKNNNHYDTRKTKQPCKKNI